MSTKPTHAILQMLIERKPMALAKAAECDASHQVGMALYWRLAAFEAATLYAWIVADNKRNLLVEVERNQLIKLVQNIDDQLLNYHVMLARAAMAEEEAA